jgi:hypothetical protein
MTNAKPSAESMATTKPAPTVTKRQRAKSSHRGGKYNDN